MKTGMISTVWYRIGRTLVQALGRLALRFDVQYHIPLPPGPIILAANHPSMIDPAILTTLTPSRVNILILDTIFKVPIFGRSLRWCGHIPVVEGNGQAVFVQASAILKAGGTLAIFPEGVITSLTSPCQRPRTGVARLALGLGVPVIPVGISLDPVFLRHITTRIAGKKEIATWYFHGPYAITVGEPMRFSGDPEDRERVYQVGEQIMQRVASLRAESSLRIQTARRPTGLTSYPLRAFWYVLSRSLDILEGAGSI